MLLKEIREKAGEVQGAIKQHQERMVSDSENYTKDDEAKFDELCAEYDGLRCDHVRQSD